MSNIIVDASIILQMFDEAEAGKKAWKFFDQIQKGHIVASAPSFLLIEVLNVLLKKKKIPTKKVKEFIELLGKSGINFIDFSFRSIGALSEVAIRERITVYDALYVSLARGLEQRLITNDKELLMIPNISVSLDEFITI
ncbi:MAG: type II toxin-antitoxin system VapC family toxin [Patescibacteria group bacterium]